MPSTMTEEQIMDATGCDCQIAEDAAKHGYTPVYLRDNGKLGDARLALYECNGSYAIKTNGDTVWMDGVDGDVWAELMAQIDE